MAAAKEVIEILDSDNEDEKDNALKSSNKDTALAKNPPLKGTKNDGAADGDEQDLKLAANPVARPRTRGDCAICFCEYTPDDGVSLRDCGHQFCQDCIATYIQTKAKDGEVSPMHMKCPAVEPVACNLPIAQSDVLTFLKTPQDRDRYLRLTVDRFVDAHPENMSCCPSPGCGFLFEYDDDNRKLECPLCHQSYCLVCRAGPWHTGIRCEEYQRRQKSATNNNNKEDAAFEKFASKQKLKQCPKCRFWIEKDHGCDAMHCRCGLVFCYKCGGCLKGGGGTKQGFKTCQCGHDDILQAHENSSMNHNLMDVNNGIRPGQANNFGHGGFFANPVDQFMGVGGFARGGQGFGQNHIGMQFPGGGRRLGGGPNKRTRGDI